MHKTSRIIQQSIVLLLSLVLSGFSYAYRMEVSQQQLQEKLQAQPLKHEDALFKVHVNDPKVMLLETQNRIALTAEIQVFLLDSLAGVGQTEIQGRLEYNQQQGAFYFKDAKINSLAIDKMPAEHLPMIEQVLETTLRNSLNAQPIYVLDDQDTQQKLAKATLQTVTVKNQAVILDFALF